MSGSKSLPVIMPTIPGQRWSCHSCGDCCRNLVVHISADERRRIDQQGWRQKLGVEPYVKTGRLRVLNKHDDGACVFLDSDNRCKIHTEYGEKNKPLSCRIFPFSVREVSGGWQASLRFDCPSVTSSKGEPIDTHQGWLRKLVRQLDHSGTSKDTTYFVRGLLASPEEIEAVLQRYIQWFDHEKFSLLQQIAGAARITSTLFHAKLKKVRGARFTELLDLLFGALESESDSPSEKPTRRQRGMLRQLAFAHAEHVSLAQLRRGFWGRLRKRKQQLNFAKRFLHGEGDVPILPGFSSTPTFAQVESIIPATENVSAIQDLTKRYIIARLSSRSVFGSGYYGWHIFPGLSALWLSVAVAGWLARFSAACSNRTAITYDDVAHALGIVDRAATRLPALGLFSERARVLYLLQDEGIVRLIHQYNSSD